MASGSFKCYVEQKTGKFAFFFIYAVLEWVMIILLFIEGFLAFFSNEFAKFFDLKIPCLLCTRIDHVLVQRDANFYYNDSICEVHKKDISPLAYCHVHKKLSDIKNMCDGCLLSFATEKDLDCDRYKSLVGILHKDIDCFVEDVQEKNKEADEVTQTTFIRCSCCGEPLKMKSKYSRNASMKGNNPYSQAPAPSPRSPWRNEAHYTEVKFISNNYLDIPDDGGREDIKAATVPDSEEINDDALKTPNFTRNKFFGIPLLDSVQASPRWSHKPRKLSMDIKNELISDETSVESDDDILHRLKRQVRLDYKSLMALYMELDEERSAAAVAAKNAMAMITRLQAEKAAVQMEALQYQRMMEEQAEYDQEALQVMKDLLLKREEEIKALEAEFETYRERYGHIRKVGSEVCEVDADEDYQKWNSHSLSSLSETSDCVSPDEGGANNDRSFKYGLHESHLDFENEKSYLMSLLTNVEEKINTYKDERFHVPESNNIKHESKGKGNESKVTLTREVSVIRERLRAVEAESGFLKHAAMTLQRDGEGTKLLTEIAEHLRRLRQSIDSLSNV
ncbi:LOW QUALITY PROTEIN: probable myosin-binding protein 5 [Lycium ferocissimum]|uniref:LOW QUALITY PROTEIN: probable myosin-binding protein 5 n=1 Tax=Lycium ferocissimum TaxID=112874 RepID=UPI002815099A|nr:LOW QUALITY PROTEIN: probable myosin-binding protein 5 [Lycium ferocissimum]